LATSNKQFLDEPRLAFPSAPQLLVKLSMHRPELRRKEMIVVLISLDVKSFLHNRTSVHFHQLKYNSNTVEHELGQKNANRKFTEIKISLVEFWDLFHRHF